MDKKSQENPKSKGSINKEEDMQVIKFQNEIISGDQESTLRWLETSDDELMVEVFTTEALFDGLEVYWKDVVKRADTSIYMSYEWAQNWWKHFGKNKQRSLLVVTIWDGSKLVGLAPFYKGHSRLGSHVIEQRVQIIGSGGTPNEQYGYKDDYGISDFLDIIVDREYTAAVTNRLSELITPEFLGADVITFHQLRDDSYIKNHLYPKLQERGVTMSMEHTDTCPIIPLKHFDNLKAYIKDQKSNARRRLRQTQRAEGPEGTYQIEELTDWDDIQRATDELIELHQSRWNRMGFPGVFYDQRFTQFFKDTLEYAHNNGWLWFKQATDEEGMCASRMILQFQGRYYDYISGFDELRPSSKYRPGIGLLLNLVEDAISQNLEAVELLRGEEGYKYDFTSNNFKNWKLTVVLTDKKSIPLLLNRLSAVFYKYLIQELRLLNVQKKQKGMLRMLFGYLNFRWSSVKMKFGL